MVTHPTPRAAHLFKVLILATLGCGSPPVSREWTTLDPEHPLDYARPDLPPHYRDPAVTALDNTRLLPVSNRVAALGHVLFFDRSLSVDRTVRCASCHLPTHGFADTARFSRGHRGEVLTVRTMRLVNARWYAGPGFFWDRRVPTLEAQATHPITNAMEMGWDDAHGGLDALLARLASRPYYPELVSAAFGDAAITRDRLERALAAYVRSIVAVDSRWDREYAAVHDPALPDKGLDRDLPGFTPQENEGRALFIRSREAGGFGCASCHVPPTFALDPMARGNGLEPDAATIFKAPSLKNVAQAGPWMHDGRMPRLDLVVAFYADFVNPGPVLDARLRNPDGSQIRLHATQAQTEAIAAFLATLTDTTLAHDPRYRDPFR